MEDTALIMEIGNREDLSLENAKRVAEVWKIGIERVKPVAVAFSIGGYDDDPRGLYEIPEVCRYIQWWAQLVGLDDMRIAGRINWLEPHQGVHMAVLARCGAFGPTIARLAIEAGDGPSIIYNSDREPCEHQLPTAH